MDGLITRVDLKLSFEVLDFFQELYTGIVVIAVIGSVTRVIACVVIDRVTRIVTRSVVDRVTRIVDGTVFTSSRVVDNIVLSGSGVIDGAVGGSSGIVTGSVNRSITRVRGWEDSWVTLIINSGIFSGDDSGVVLLFQRFAQDGKSLSEIQKLHARVIAWST